MSFFRLTLLKPIAKLFFCLSDFKNKQKLLFYRFKITKEKMFNLKTRSEVISNNRFSLNATQIIIHINNIITDNKSNMLKVKR